ncbi:hypothetical protein OCC47_24245 [Bacillus cereus]|nr:hypothetical protein [Bacillus cereus]MCU9578605.1 hypothetical protein [Bacillus cereus]
MLNHNKAKENSNSILKLDFVRTDTNKVKQEIQKDVSEGQGAMRD